MDSPRLKKTNDDDLAKFLFQRKIALQQECEEAEFIVKHFLRSPLLRAARFIEARLLEVRREAAKLASTLRFKDKGTEIWNAVTRDQLAHDLLKSYETRKGLARNGGALKRSPSPARPSVKPQSIKLPKPTPHPFLSIVILSYGEVDYTLRCIKSIAESLLPYSVEVVVSDDCSGDGALSKLKEVSGLRTISPPENLGFLKHANWAVDQTSGAYVLLLNNDVEVSEHAIEALLTLAEKTPDIGLVGPKLIYPDGTLQEAGGIVWDDASAWNYGRLDDPEKPEYNYVRDVDYVSGAALLIPRTVWAILGGFNEAFCPAY